MVDVIVPVYRPDDKLKGLIHRLKTQTRKPDHVFFMHTLTGTKEDKQVKALLETMPGAVITPIEKKDFDHGGTRNLGASLSKEPFMLFITQDAIPQDDILIEEMLKAMENPQVATAYGRQLPNDEVGYIEEYTRSFNYPEESSIKSKADLERLGIKTYFCSNVCAMYRKCVYKELGGFVTQTIFNEDMIIASKVIDAGYHIAYVATAQVVHAHKYTYRQQFTRNFDMAVSQRQYHEIFDKVKSESEGIRLVKKTASHLMKHGKWYLLPDLVLQSGFKFLGYRFGKKYQKLPKKMVRKFSMNKAYWNEK